MLATEGNFLAKFPPSKRIRRSLIYFFVYITNPLPLFLLQSAASSSAPMARRARNPRNRRRKEQEEALDFSDQEDGDPPSSTSDSDYVLDEDKSNFDGSGGDEHDEDANAPATSPPPPHGVEAAAASDTTGDRGRRRQPRRTGRKKARLVPLLWEVWEQENDEWISDRLMEEEEDNSIVESVEVAETADPSPDITLGLLRFQKEWLAWALKQEDSDFRGGILADEMGMGKTIQAISLVLTARSLQPKCSGSGLDSNAACSSSLLPETKCTLVVCPVVAVIQWMEEIRRHTREGSTRVLVYHGAKRDKKKYEFNDYDFVITTYSTIETDYRKHLMPPKEKCRWCDKMLYPEKMSIHLKYYCGPHACKTEKQAKQVSKKKDVKLKLKGKKMKFNKTKKHNAQGYKSLDSSQGKSILHSVKWKRIILDEAHFIKDRRSNTAKAIFALVSSYKWALSGTPLQNRVGELYSLVRFLQIWPYSFYLCKDCDCKVLDYGSSGRDCDTCPHSRVRHLCWWNKFIANPIQKESAHNGRRRAMILLKERILKSVLLRRTKEGRAADLALPPRIVYLRRDSLDIREQEFYEALYTQSRVQFDAYAEAGTLLNNYAHIFDLLTRLRQAVDHPYLVLHSKTAEVSDAQKDDTMKQDCGICHDPPEDMVVTSCEHVFCKACLTVYSASMENVTCPLCSKPLTVDLTTKSPGVITAAVIKGYKSGILNRIKDIEAFRTSTKIDALQEEIWNMLESDGSAKGIVFSQYTSFLDLIRFSLQKSGVKCVQLVGSMSLVERDKAIKAFTDDGDCKIFLMSLKAGGVALNLTVASHVFLMDPWWNPAVERQAQDRIHRIGQYKPIRIIRFVIEDTIEERILKLQEKKELVFQGTIGHCSEAIAKLTEEDLRFLFQV